MNRPRLALLDASYWSDATRRNFRRELAADLVEFDVKAGELPSGIDIDGVVVTGSAASVYWNEAWIDETATWLRTAIDDGTPTLGVCFGHQLVASALDGTVEAMGDYELGYREIERTAETPLFEGLGERFLAFESHSDAVTGLPPGADLIAENDRGIQGFRRGAAFTVQFHPEYDMETAETVARSKDLPADRIDAVVADITEQNYRRACETKRLFDNFVRYVETQRVPPAD